MKLLLMLACGLTLAWSKTGLTTRSGEAVKKDELEKTVDAILNRLMIVEAQNEGQAQEIDRQAQEIDRQAQEINGHAQEIDRQARENDRQAQEIDRQAQEIDRQAQEIDRQAQENDRQAQEIDRQAQENDRQAQEIDRQARKINSLTLTADSLTQALDDQAKVIETLQWKNSQLTMSNFNPENVTSRDLRNTPEPDTRSQFTAFSCTNANTSLACPSNKSILVTSGNYAGYGVACSTGCCPPNPEFDCTELIEENSPQDWLAIQALCDGQQSCQFHNYGTMVNDCEDGYLSDYMQLFYDCLPNDETGPVGFTASANTGGPVNYRENDVIVFNEVLSNFGGHYNPATSSFICPVGGVYLISVNVLTSVSEQMYADIMHNREFLARAFADNVSNADNRASTVIVSECSRGDSLWVRSPYAGSLLANENRHNAFTVYLMHRF